MALSREPPSLDNWDPLPLDEAADLFADAPFRWWICGGHALDLHADTSWRPHEDLDVGIVRAEADKVYTWLSGWDLWVAARGTLRPWRGVALEPDGHENNVWARRASASPWRFDLTVGSGNDAEWIYRRDGGIRRSWDATVMWTNDGLPYLAPEVQLLFKSKGSRPKDNLDARQVIPLLDADQRAFLRAHIDRGHAWRQLLGQE